MNPTPAFDLVALSPLLALSAAIVVLLLVVSFGRHHTTSLVLTLLGLGGAGLALKSAAGAAMTQVTPLLKMDDFTILIFAAVLVSSFVVAVLSHSYLERRHENPEEFYILLLLGTLGAAVMAGATHFMSFFLGLETLSVSLYGMIAYSRSGKLGVEAAIKYLLLAGAASAFLLFGMALLYSELGSMQFADLGALLGSAPQGSMLLAAGLGFMMVGAGFKLAVVPFHFWTPDVYEGAPAPVTAYIATVSKGGMVAVLLRFFTEVGIVPNSALFYVVSAIAAASILAGNLLALLQTNVKRVLAFSSIAHLGYLLVAFLAAGAVGNEMALEAVTFYLITYMATSLASFGVVSVLSSGERDADSLEDFRGLFWRKPWLAGVMTVSLLSLAGIPMTAGFVGKFYILAAGMESSLYALMLTLALGSAIGIYYYLRIILAMLWQPETAHGHAGHGPGAKAHGTGHGASAGAALGGGAGYGAGGTALAGAPWVPFAAGLVLTLVMLSLLWLGVQPGPMQTAIEAAVTSLR